MSLTITNEDCMDLMSRYPDNHFDLAIVDPPYGIGMGGGLVGNSKKNYKQFAGQDENIPDAKYFTELFRVSQNQIIWGGNYMVDYLYPTSCFIVWDKMQPENFTMAMAEMAWTSFTSPAKIFKKWAVNMDEQRLHPTQKPIKLYEWLLDNYAKEGDKILDTHLGSGSIAIACHYRGFDLTACELDEDYYIAAMKRIKEQTSQIQMF